MWSRSFYFLPHSFMVVVLAVVGAVGCSQNKASLPTDQSIPKTAAPAVPSAVSAVAAQEGQSQKKLVSEPPENQEVDRASSLTGTVMALHSSQLAFREAGYLDAVLIKNGDHVSKGQVLAKLDASLLLQQLNSAKATLDKAKVSAHFSRLSLQRAENLNAHEATTQSALEQAQSTSQQADAAVLESEAAYELAKINYNNAKLTAPFDGYVFNLVSWVGSYIGASSPLVTLVSLADLQVQISVPQNLSNSFHVGQVLSFSSVSGRATGSVQVSSIVPYVVETTKTYMVFATIRKPVPTALMGGELLTIELPKS